MIVYCANCCRPTDKPTGAVNRAGAIGARLYCDRTCAGMQRLAGKTKAQKVAEKRIYDMAYRAKNLDRIKADKRAYFQRTYDPRKAAVERKRGCPCTSPTAASRATWPGSGATTRN
jgi:hypothetical protein